MSITTMNHEEIRNRLLELGNVYGPEVLIKRHNVLDELAVQYLRKAATEDDPVVRMDRLCQADRYMSMAQVVKRADELEIDREAMVVMLEEQEMPSLVPMHMLRNARQPHFKIGDFAYVRSVSEPEGDEEAVEGYMDIIIVGLEVTFDSVNYQIGFVEPTGQEVSITDEWVDEKEVVAQIPEDGDTPRPAKARPHLQIVK